VIPETANEELDKFSRAIEQTGDSIFITDITGVIVYANPAFEAVTGYPRQEALGKPVSMLKSGKHPDAFYQEFWGIILKGNTFRGQFINKKKGGELYYEEKTVTPIQNQTGNITHFISTGRDITRQVQDYQDLERRADDWSRTSAELYEQGERRRRELEALYRADEQLYRHLRLDQVLQALVDVVVDLLGADKASVQVWDPEKECLVVRAERGYSREMLDLMSGYKPGDGIAGNVFKTGQPIAVDDALNAPPPADHIARVEGIRSVLSVPINIGGQTFGVFGMDYCEPRHFSPDDKRLFLALARRAAAAINNARLYEQVEQAAILVERQRLAHELHDSVTQALYSMMLIAEAGRRLAQRGDLRQSEHHLKRIGETAQQSLKEMRLLVFEMGSPELQTGGLVEAIQKRLNMVEKRSGIQARLLVEGERCLSIVQEQEIYRIIIEALNNSLKHSGSNEVKVQICTTDEKVEVNVSDHGQGFSQEDLAELGGVGLASMRYRAERIGAALTIQSAPNEGTRVQLRLPRRE
jgi:PAS domain S-box-containing protein